MTALGGLDILVNSAAIAHTGTIADIDTNNDQVMMDVNVRAPVLFAKAVIPHLAEGGRIVTIGSALGERVQFPGIKVPPQSVVTGTVLTADGGALAQRVHRNT